MGGRPAWTFTIGNLAEVCACMCVCVCVNVSAAGNSLKINFYYSTMIKYTAANLNLKKIASLTKPFNITLSFKTY